MSEIGQNPSTALSTLPKKNKTPKRSAKPKNKNNFTTSNKYNTDDYCNKPPNCKVVHISNPMKFQVHAEEFRALVQGLTGRDAAEWPDYCYNNQTNLAHVVGAAEGTVDGSKVHGGGYGDDDGVVEVIQQEQLDDQQVDYSGSSDLSLDYDFEPFDGDVLCGGGHHEHDSHHRVFMEDFQAFMGGYNL